MQAELAVGGDGVGGDAVEYHPAGINHQGAFSLQREVQRMGGENDLLVKTAEQAPHAL